MVRFPNLIFIALTQVLFYTCVVLPLFHTSGVPLISGHQLFLLVLGSSVLIAAGGYIINDYFDVPIDQVNKPGKIIVGRLINRRWALVFHLLFTSGGIVMGIIAAIRYGTHWIAWVNVLCAVLLWFYSTSLKKQLLVGNVLISLLTAWVIGVVYFSMLDSNQFHAIKPEKLLIGKLTRIMILYCCFAFVISLVREIVKDMEDLEGDVQYGCKTMPAVWGLHVSKLFSATWAFILLAGIFLLQFYVIVNFSWWLSALYALLFVIVPLGVFLMKLMKAVSQVDFHQLSTIAKLIMLSGILSLLFFRFLLS